MAVNAEALYKSLKKKPTQYDEAKHCVMILKIMTNKDKGTMSAFCVEAKISDWTFWNWVNKYDMFRECYLLGKMYSREAWEEEGRQLRGLPMQGCDFEYWRLIGWSRFGIGKNSRIRLNLDPLDNPAQHYSQLMKQASEGAYTAGEIKQLMEAINVGLNTHQAFAMQKEIDELKSDLAKMSMNTNVQNPFTNKGIAQKD